MARIHGHPLPYDFGEVAVLVGPDFCARLVKVWGPAFGADIPAYTDKRKSALLQFLRYAAAAAEANPEGPEAVTLDGLESGEVSPVEYADATAAFCARLHDRGDKSVVESDNKRTRNNIINGLSATLMGLAKAKLLPIDHGMTAIPTGPFEPRILTVAEVSREGPLDRLDARATFSALLGSTALSGHLGLRPADASVMGAQELAEAMVKVLALRLEALRDCAVADLEEEEAVMDAGSALLARTDLPSAHKVRSAIFSWNVKDGIGPLLKTLERAPWATLPGDPSTRLLGHVVRVMAPEYSGVFKVSKLYWKLAAAMHEAGGLLAVTRHLEATMAAKTAAHLIVLIDTMFNVSVCDRLAADPFTGRVSRGTVEVATVQAIKRRAGHKVVFGKILDGPEEVDPAKSDPGKDGGEVCFVGSKRTDGKKSGVWAIKTWLKMSRTVRERAKEEGGDTHLYLWILPKGGARHRGSVRRPHFTSDIAAWHEFLEKHRENPLVGGLPITREMIRVSCLQARTGPNDDSGRVMPREAQHARAGTSFRYGDSPSNRELLGEQIRAFQNLLEATFSKDVEDIARVLGLDPEVVLERRDLALQTGLGFFCLEPLLGERPGTTVGVPCDKLEDCPACRLRRFVPNPEALEALWLFGKVLRDAQEVWEATRPERWRSFWLPWLAIVIATEDVLNSGRFKARFERAKLAGAERLASGTLSAPVLW